VPPRNDVGAEFARTGAAYLSSFAGDASIVMRSGGAIFGAADGDQFGYSVAGDYAVLGGNVFGIGYHAAW
jgi:hypothetical protein